MNMVQENINDFSLAEKMALYKEAYFAVQEIEREMAEVKEKRDRMTAFMEEVHAAITEELSQRHMRSGVFAGIKYSTKNTKSVVVTDEEALPVEYWTKIPDKAEIRRALLIGDGVPGAELFVKQSVALKPVE
jgi:hypothetical protein